MPIIIVDANILVSSPRLRAPEWQSLFEHRTDWDLQFVVPEVALMETVKTVRTNWGKEKRALERVKLGEFGFTGQQDAMLAEIDSCIKAYELELSELLTKVGVQVVATPAVDHMEIARRAAAGRAPFHSKDKDCYRDALIWHTVLAVAEANPGVDIWFVSDNHGDFGPIPPHWTGENSGVREDCPLLFHTHLATELKELGLSDRVQYVISVKSLERHLAALSAPISSKDLHEAIDLLHLTTQFKERVVDLSLKPRVAALDPSTDVATVATATPLPETWDFLDGARRGSSGWSARFVVTAETFYAWIDRHRNLSTDHKQLVFSGDIVVAEDGSIPELVLASAHALPDDPMRELWPDDEQVQAAMATVKGLTERELWGAMDALRGSLPPDQLQHILRDAVRASGADNLMRQAIRDAASEPGGQERLRKIFAEDILRWQQER